MNKKIILIIFTLACGLWGLFYLKFQPRSAQASHPAALNPSPIGIAQQSCDFPALCSTMTAIGLELTETPTLEPSPVPTPMESPTSEIMLESTVIVAAAGDIACGSG